MRYLTAGESHGPGLTVIVEGMPSHVPISIDRINEQLRRRQMGYGRGRRMQIETDRVQILAGERFSKTTGAPISMWIENKDWTHWQKIMSIIDTPDDEVKRRVSRPRPGHADLNGAIKYNHRDMRNILERSSARETAARVAIGGLARELLREFNIDIAGHVLQIGTVKAQEISDIEINQLKQRSEQSPVRCLDPNAGQLMMNLIDQAKEEGDSIGGIVEVRVEGVPTGLGSHVQWDRKLDGKIAQAVMSIQAFKGVEFGIGFEAGERFGSSVHDEIAWNEDKGYYRMTNRLGGFEGGMSTGEQIIVRGVMKPIPTLYKPLRSVDIDTKEAFEATIERSDSCAVPAASVVMENVIAWEIANEMVVKFGGDSIDEMKRNYDAYMNYVEKF